MILLIFLSTLFPLLLLYLLHANRGPTTKLVPPGPPGLPLIGNMHQLAAAKNPHVYLWRLSKKYGPIMRLNVGPKPLIVISSAKLAEQVMKTQDQAFCGRPNSLGWQRLSYNCSDIAFSSYNNYWREVRKITTVHLFSSKKTQSFRHVREDEISRLISEISGFAANNRVLNMSETAVAVGTTLTCRIAFGKWYSGLGPEMRRFDGLLKRAQALMAGFFVSDYYPRFGWVDRLCGSIGRLERTFEDLDSFYQELIDEHLDPNKPDTMAGDILDTLIQLKQNGSTSVDLSWDNIKALLMNIFIAATDTSSASIIWTMTALMKAPQVMRRVQTEIRNSIEKKDIVDEDDLPKLSYLKAVINEAFRLYPPVPLLVPRETLEKCTLEGYEIQPKSIVYVNAWAVARDPECWENPNEFLPERFLNSNIDIKGQDFGVVPFGSGRRSCPAIFMGLANVELTLANMLHSFDWELPQGIQAKDIDTDSLPGLTPTNNPVPPGPPGLPLIGNMHQLAAARTPHIYLWRLSKIYGPILRMNLGPKPLIVVSSAKLAEKVMKAQDQAFCSRPNSLGRQRLSYNCSDIAFSPYNNYWREVRKITTVHLFNINKALSFRPVREDEISRAVIEISGFAARNEVLNMSEMVMALGATLTCRIAFGKRYGGDGNDMRRFDELMKRIQGLLAGFFVSDYFPRFGWVDWLCGSVGRLEKTFEDMDSFYQELIDEHLDPNKPETMAGDILDTLIKLKQNKSTSVDLSWDNIKALLMETHLLQYLIKSLACFGILLKSYMTSEDIFVAATSTSSASIIWTMTALIKEPQLMRRVQTEIRNSIGKKAMVDEDDLPKLFYLKAVINESFRLYPPAPLLLPRETIEKCTLEGYEIQPKSIVYVNAWAVARDPERWENPDGFLPERFLNSNIDIKGQDFGVVPFGSGRRSCPGIFMGLANVELTLANMLHSFDWELPQGIQPEDVDTEPLLGLAVHKKNPLLLVPKRYIVN
ncbi:cytochrome P450 [Striga asiatica]|uniref:Cytochrome P450 n=1 Tax=Striga asiatica TaxID=4170 RepID=A0A5A7P860_STRAF|nr:cytochrome P450 [Striga asiatica]